MFCPQCGESNSDDAGVCSRCGYDLSRLTQQPELSADSLRSSSDNPAPLAPGEAPQRSSMAMWSVVFDILGFLFCCLPLFGLIGAILGAVSLSRIRKSQGRLTGSGLAITGLILGLISIIFNTIAFFIGLMIIPQYLEEATGSKVARAKSDLRSLTASLDAYMMQNNLPAPTILKVTRTNADLRTLAVGLEAYYIDQNTVPPSAVRPDSPGLPPTFTGNILTTPIGYLTNMKFRDPYASGRDNLYRYHVDANGKDWIVWGMGPDRVYNLTGSNMGEVFNFGGPPSDALLNLSYDPTNGATSSGDIWRSNEGYGN